MRKLELDEIKSLSLDGLACFRDFMERHHLRYYLAWGTLLGAVRHQGFIPWDDDIDLWLPRRDYEVLLSKVSEFETADWTIVHYSLDKRYILGWAKLVNKRTHCAPSVVATGYSAGLSIDLFPLDFVDLPIQEAQREATALIAPRFKRLERFHPSVVDVHASALKRAVRRLYFHYRCLADRPYHELMEQYDHLFLHTDDATAPTAVDYVSTGIVFMERRLFGDGADVSFEGGTYRAPADADKVLTALYGDYMQLPPVEQRVTHHLYDTYWL